MDGQADYVRDAANGLALYPERASTIAGDLDALFYALVAISLFIVLLIGGMILYYSLRYREGRTTDRESRLTERQGMWIEVAWTVPTVLAFVGIFGWGASVYLTQYGAVAADVEISVIGKQWMWKIQHPNGVREINELHVPVGRKVKLRLTSQDVIHSFYIPAFRLKRDVLPQRYTSFWFEATKPGTYSLFCAELCGADHSVMRGRVVAMQPAAFERWMSAQDAPSAPAAQGRNLFEAYGCSGCHAPGSNVHAPSLAGIFGRPVQLAGGGTTVADDDYIRDSILLPRKHVVAGYQPVMPSFQDQIGEGDMLKLLAYIKSLDDGGRKAGAP